jgi:cold shock CspA family protein
MQNFHNMQLQQPVDPMNDPVVQEMLRQVNTPGAGLDPAIFAALGLPPAAMQQQQLYGNPQQQGAGGNARNSPAQGSPAQGPQNPWDQQYQNNKNGRDTTQHYNQYGQQQMGATMDSPLSNQQIEQMLGASNPLLMNLNLNAAELMQLQQLLGPAGLSGLNDPLLGLGLGNSTIPGLNDFSAASQSQSSNAKDQWGGYGQNNKQNKDNKGQSSGKGGARPSGKDGYGTAGNGYGTSSGPSAGKGYGTAGKGYGTSGKDAGGKNGYGTSHSTAPGQKGVGKGESIQEIVAKKGLTAATAHQGSTETTHTGTIRRFVKTQGWGFVDSEGIDVYVHMKQVVGNRLGENSNYSGNGGRGPIDYRRFPVQLDEGMWIAFKLGQSKGRAMALNIQPIPEAAISPDMVEAAEVSATTIEARPQRQIRGDLEMSEEGEQKEGRATRKSETKQEARRSNKSKEGEPALDIDPLILEANGLSKDELEDLLKAVGGGMEGLSLAGAATEGAVEGAVPARTASQGSQGSQKKKSSRAGSRGPSKSHEQDETPAAKKSSHGTPVTRASTTPTKERGSSGSKKSSSKSEL